ncbi:MAG: Uma2 family endonuclease [Synechococcaceae cyanobacterium SM2_3_1]|nr:Uma2 family endonuclease [Synechococcaceae cyanobacterium SM2_3_1]
MTQTTMRQGHAGANRKFTFADYLDYNDGIDFRHELENGDIVIMPTASPLHAEIIRLLFLLMNQEIVRLGRKDKVFATGVGIRTGIRTSREPDICIIHAEDWEALRKQNPKSAIVERPPLLVVEVVSPGEDNREKDYKLKVREYQELGISEYWVVDPEDEKVTVFTLQNRSNYLASEFKGIDIIKSQYFSELELIVDHLFITF